MDYEMYKRGIDVKEFNEELIQKVLYSSEVSSEGSITTVTIKGDN